MPRPAEGFFAGGARGGGRSRYGGREARHSAGPRRRGDYWPIRRNPEPGGGHQLPNVERRTSNVERRTSNVERRTSNVERRTSNVERRTSNVERRTSN
ncbi:hypothetical protein WS77_08580, partial [Burkholderia sp. MSMB0265]